MSNTAVLERAPKMYTSLKDRLITPAEEAHKQKIADNFRRLRFESPAEYNSAKAGDPVAGAMTAPVTEKQPEIPSAAERIAQYTPITAPTGSRELFADVPRTETYDAPQASVQEAVFTAAPPAPAADEEDAVPTRRTMDTLTRYAAKENVEVAERTGIRAALSTKTKVILAAICAAIVFAIVLIGINSGIIRSINSDIMAKQSQLEELTHATRSVQEEIAELTSPESIAEWAAKNNMVLGE